MNVDNWRTLKDQDVRVRWLLQVEDYYRDEYPNSMYVKVHKILPTDWRILKALFDEVTSLQSAQFKTVPDKRVIAEALEQVYESYPEFRAHSYNKQLEHQRALPEPNLEEEIERERRRQKEARDFDPLQAAMDQERSRIRRKRDKTPCEGWWLWCMEHGGKYTAMPEDWNEKSYDERMEQDKPFGETG